MKDHVCVKIIVKISCVLEDILRETIKDIGKKPCNAKGSCGKNKVCVYACHHFNCYVETTKFLGYTKQCLLPICIQLKIEFYFRKLIKRFQVCLFFSHV
jgi:hypothetical protein